MKISGAFRKHYEEFPENIEDFNDWVIKAEELWSPVEKMEYTRENQPT